MNRSSAKRKGGKKSGQAELIEILGLCVLAAAALVFALLVLPRLLSDIYGLIALSSAEVVGRDIAGFITISAASPQDILIKHTLDPKHEYSVKIENRLVKIKLLTIEYGMKGSAITKTGVDGIDFDPKTPVNYLEITKSLVGEESLYNVEGQLIR